jgi:hypothetical protein
MKNEIENIWKEVVVAYSIFYPGICLKRQRKTTKKIAYVFSSVLRTAYAMSTFH